MAVHAMVVDDEKEIADLIELYLKNENYQVHKFYRADAALECLKRMPMDIALLDVMMPGIDGFDTKLNVSILSLMRQCTDYALRYSHNSERWFAPVLEKKFFD